MAELPDLIVPFKRQVYERGRRCFPAPVCLKPAPFSTHVVVSKPAPTFGLHALALLID